MLSPYIAKCLFKLTRKAWVPWNGPTCTPLVFLFAFISFEYKVLFQAPCLSNLEYLTRVRVVAPQDGPRRGVGLGQRHLELRAQDLERRLLRVDGGEEGHLGGVPLGGRVGRHEVEVDLVVAELDGRLVLDDLLEEEGRDDGGRGLVEVVPVYLELIRRIKHLGAVPSRGKEGRAYLTVSRTSSPPALPLAALSLPLPMNMCLSLVAHPSSFMNWSNSMTRLLQQEYPLLPSWKMGTPGWKTHDSPSLLAPLLYSALHPLLLHAFPSGISRLGSSSSDSACGGGGVGTCWGATGFRSGTEALRLSILAASSESVSAAAFFSSSGGLSVVECWPSVQGGISMNSSKVRTRGLQHFHPNGSCASAHGRDPGRGELWGCGHTLLALVEDGRPGVVVARLGRALVEGLAATLVDTLERHLGCGGKSPAFEISPDGLVCDSSARYILPSIKDEDSRPHGKAEILRSSRIRGERRSQRGTAGHPAKLKS